VSYEFKPIPARGRSTKGRLVDTLGSSPGAGVSKKFHSVTGVLYHIPPILA
jgi:hypothetical protein